MTETPAEAVQAAMETWEPLRWYRIRKPDGTLWMETSDKIQISEAARTTGWPVERLWAQRSTQVWAPVGTVPPEPSPPGMEELARELFEARYPPPPRSGHVGWPNVEPGVREAWTRVAERALEVLR